MPGELACNDSGSGWTTETVLEHVIQVLNERDKRYQQRFDAQEKALGAALLNAATAVDKAETTNTAWRQNQNEWRGALSDRDRLFIPRQEFDAKVEALDERISSITRICVGAVFIGIAIITVVLLILKQ